MMRILLVEDEENIRSAVKLNLELDDFEVVATGSGRDALKYTREQHFDLLILDVMLPEVDGFQVVAEMKSDPQLREIPIIVITAKELSPIEKQALNGKIRKLLPKGNFMDADLIKDIDQVLG